MPFITDLTSLKNRDHVLNLLAIDEQSFQRILEFHPSETTDVESSATEMRTLHIPPFANHTIPKKNGTGHRIVWEPLLLKNEYKALSRLLGDFISSKLPNFPHHRAFGYVGGRNIRENARDHCGRQYLLSVDLKDFFPSISAIQVSKFLQSIDIESDVADLLSRFVTIGGSLPLGLPTSPIIANALCLPLDIDLESFCLENRVVFSRYADDLSFSSDTEPPSLPAISAIIARNGFEIACSKTRTSKRGQTHYVTGLSVSDPTQPHVPRKMKHRLRTELYFARKYGLIDHFHRHGIYSHDEIQRGVNRIDGTVRFVAFHEPRLAHSIKEKWASVLRESGWRPSFKPKDHTTAPFFIYIDESEFRRSDNSVVLALGMAVTQHQDQIVKAAREVLEEFLSDPWAAGDREAIRKNGLHFSDAHPDLRLTYIRRLRSMPFEGYVAFASLHEPSEYERTYIRLIRAIIKRRLMAAESKAAYVFFETNNKVNQEAVKQAVWDAFISLRKANNRSPARCHVSIARKPDLGLSVPDFLLGVLRGYLRSKSSERTPPYGRDELLFEQIRDKYRLIFDLDERVEYSRRRPITPWQG